MCGFHVNLLEMLILCPKSNDKYSESWNQFWILFGSSISLILKFSMSVSEKKTALIFQEIRIQKIVFEDFVLVYPAH